MKPRNTNPKRHHTALALGNSFNQLEQMANGAAARKGGKANVAGDPALLKAIAEKPRKAVTAASAAKPRPSTVKGDGKLKKVGKANPVQSQTVDNVATGVEPVGLPDHDESSLVESSSEDSSSNVSFSEGELASEDAADYSDSYEYDANWETKIPLAQQVPAKRTAGAPSRADRIAEGNRAKGKVSLDAYFKGMTEKAKSGSAKKSVVDQFKDSAFRDNGPVEFMQAFRTACKDFFSPMEKAIERSFDASLIKKGVKPKPEHNARRKHTTDAEQQALDEALKNFDLGPMARFGKKLAHTLVAPLSFDARIKARLKGESFSTVAARAAFDQFPAGGKAMLKDVVASFWKLDDFHKLTLDDQEKTLRDAVTACIVTYGVNKVSLDTAREQFSNDPVLTANGLSAMALAQTYLKASFGLKHAVTGDSGAIADLVSGSEKKRAGSFIDLLLKDACDGYVSTIVDPYSPAYVATADEITGTMLRMVKDNPAAVDTKVAADVPRMSYALVGKSGTVDLPCQSKASEKQSEARVAKVWDHIGHKNRNGFRRRIALCATQELKNAVIKLAFESDGRFLQDYPGCLPRLDMATQVSITHLSSDKTTVRLEGSFDGAGKSVVLKRGGFETVGELKDFRMHYVAEATISDLSADSDRPIKLGPIRFTMENLTVHRAA